MEHNDVKPGASTLTFTDKPGMFLRRRVLVLCAILYAASLIVAVLITYYAVTAKSGNGRPGDEDGAGGTTDESGERHSTVPPTVAPKVNVRLPRDLRPLHYDLHLQPYLEPNNFTFDGKVTVVMEAVKETRVITLHALTINVTAGTVKLNGPHGRMEVTGPRFDEVRQFILFDVAEPLKPGNSYNLSMEYVGVLGDILAGFYRSSYGGNRWLATTQFQPTDARRALPCFDEPGLKAKFKLTMVRLRNMTTISNMPLEQDPIDLGNGWMEDHFLTTPNMSTYLLAFVVSDFLNQTHEAKNENDTEFRVFARPEAIDQVDYALLTGPKVLNHYNEFFNVRYPLPKQDMIAIPDFSAGAMENWGLITYRETALLLDKKFAANRNKQRVAIVIAHELAHQWFGNLVTPEWWEDLWLNEGFASYVEYIGVNYVHSEWKMLEQFLSEELHPVLELDSLKSSHPVSVPVNDPDEISEIFDTISYAKGASVIRMMHHFLGETVFKAGLTSYLLAKQYDNAVQDDLWLHLTLAAKNHNVKGIDVKTIMDTWTKQTGYPVVRVIRDYNGQSATLTPTLFLMDPESHDKNARQPKWEIPITFASQTLAKFNKTQPDWWIHKTDDSIKLESKDGIPAKDQWIIVNNQQTAYYRVNYDPQNWELITNQLNSDHEKINVLNRAQILDDALDLARSGELNYTVALGLVDYLENEIEYVPWDTALSGLSYLDSMLSRSSVYGKWQTFMTELTKKIYGDVGFHDVINLNNDAEHLNHLLRSKIVQWACKLGVQDCLNNSKRLFDEWMKTNDSSNISPNLKSIVICAAVRSGGKEEWDFVWEQYLASNVGSEKDVLLQTLSCSSEAWILSRYMQMVLEPNSKIRIQDIVTVLGNIASNKIGRYLAYDFVRDKWTLLKTRFAGAFNLAKLIKTVMGSFNTPFELKQLKAFAADQAGQLASAERAMKQTIEKTEANVKWMSKNYATIEKWLGGKTARPT